GTSIYVNRYQRPLGPWNPTVTSVRSWAGQLVAPLASVDITCSPNATGTPSSATPTLVSPFAPRTRTSIDPAPSGSKSMRPHAAHTSTTSHFTKGHRNPAAALDVGVAIRALAGAALTLLFYYCRYILTTHLEDGSRESERRYVVRRSATLRRRRR